ncbi:mechanosensitive ion channel family protein [Rhodohalobacter sp. SW132]|uniref:mechanosensitive ion channel family protein n=1 Tax=Rhodohalobacter sp. SW132 TaxID=2293433 RepID=UPI000E269042|nr:mechanosensitive ion channel domain-containing protein [Rhodohalobacter sp. SW132]REL24772.1 mechanosensitive ion channel family protein [Rhodohalobacter sp. SW132]
MDLFDSLGDNSEVVTAFFLTHAMSVIGAIIILIAGYIIAGWAGKRVKDATSKSGKFDDTLVPVLSQTTRVVILVITFLLVLGQFGVQTASIIAVLGAAGLAVGLALQGTLSNVAAGMMLLILRPFKVGDAVNVAGTFGIVDEVRLFTTEMHSFDNIGITMPNSRVWGQEIQNLSKFENRRVDMEFGISYRDDMDKAIALIKEVLDADERVMAEPEPLIAVSELGDSSVMIRVRPWTETKNVWPLRYHITKSIKEKFDSNGVSIPFPQRDVHLFKKN